MTLHVDIAPADMDRAMPCWRRDYPPAPRTRSSRSPRSSHLYDQGVGIPATLPRSEHWSDILERIRFAERLNPERRDDQLLEAALEVGRTSTGMQGRGKGLAEMAGWIDHRSAGFLRITSGRGSIVYTPGGVVSRNRRDAAFLGTLIEWEVSLDD